MRLFIAIAIPEKIRAAVTCLLEELRTIAPQVKWIKPDNLHITLKFLGETDAVKLSLIEQSLAKVKMAQPIVLTLRVPAVMIHGKDPRMIWMEIRSSPSLNTLVAELENQMVKLGFPKENRAFVPHLTLARVPRSAPPWTVVPLLPKLIETIRDSSTEFGSFSTGEFHLMESKLKSSGAEYTSVHSFSFLAEA